MQTMTPTQAFIDAMTARNFEQLSKALAPDVVARFLLPRGPEQIAGAQAIARRLEGWFGGADRFAVLSTVNERIGGRRRLEWRFELCRDGQSLEVIEQVAFADEGPVGITRLDILCSGFLPSAWPVTALPVAARPPDEPRACRRPSSR